MVLAPHLPNLPALRADWQAAMDQTDDTYSDVMPGGHLGRTAAALRERLGPILYPEWLAGRAYLKAEREIAQADADLPSLLEALGDEAMRALVYDWEQAIVAVNEERAKRPYTLAVARLEYDERARGRRVMEGLWTLRREARPPEGTTPSQLQEAVEILIQALALPSGGIRTRTILEAALILPICPQAEAIMTVGPGTYALAALAGRIAMDALIQRQAERLVRVGADLPGVATGCLRADGSCAGCSAPSGDLHSGTCDWEPCAVCCEQRMACGCEQEEMVGLIARLAELVPALVEYPGG